MGGQTRVREIDPIVAALSTVRRLRGLSQEALANELHIQQSTISTWESGASTPTLYSLRRWAEALGHVIAMLPRGES